MRAPRYPARVNKRDLVGKLAVSEPLEALESRGVFPGHGIAARHWPRWPGTSKMENYFKKVIEEALAAAYEQTEPNRVVSVASWAV